MAVLVDSDILIEVTRGRDTGLLGRWSALANGEEAPWCSPVSVAELWHGARAGEQGVLSALFGALTCIPIDLEIGERAGEYLKKYAKSHSVELGDALIAATAAVHKADLWTRNQRHYPMTDLSFY